jgi:hypothetical protein
MTKSSLALKRKFSSLKMPKGNRGRPRKDRTEDGATVSNAEPVVHVSVCRLYIKSCGRVN